MAERLYTETEVKLAIQLAQEYTNVSRYAEDGFEFDYTEESIMGFLNKNRREERNTIDANSNTK